MSYTFLKCNKTQWDNNPSKKTNNQCIKSCSNCIHCILYCNKDCRDCQNCKTYNIMVDPAKHNVDPRDMFILSKQNEISEEEYVIPFNYTQCLNNNSKRDMYDTNVNLAYFSCPYDVAKQRSIFTSNEEFKGPETILFNRTSDLIYSFSILN